MDTKGLTSGVTVSPDGRSILYIMYNNNSWDIFRARLDSGRVGAPYTTTLANEVAPRFSPNGKWVALSSDESGRTEVYARSFPDPAARVQISAGGGGWPSWNADGSTIYYRSGDRIMSAKLSLTPTLRVLSRDTVVKNVSRLVRAETLVGNYDVARDGRFLAPVTSKEDYQLIVVPNWRAELEQRLAANRRATR
jgi:hypothetical protein